MPYIFDPNKLLPVPRLIVWGSLLLRRAYERKGRAPLNIDSWDGLATQNDTWNSTGRHDA